MSSPAASFVDTLVARAESLGVVLHGDLQEVRAYAADRMVHLSTCVGQPGYVKAAEAESYNIALMALGREIDAADEADARLIETLTTLMMMAARLLI